MRYIAKHYIRTGNRMLKKGDILPELPEETIQWLLEIGAIRRYMPDSWATNETAEEKTEVEAEEMEPEETTTEEEEYELPEVPEIDAMEGIVVEDAAPKRKRVQKKAKGE